MKKNTIKKILLFIMVIILTGTTYYYQSYKPIVVDSIEISVIPITDFSFESLEYGYMQVYSGEDEDGSTLLRLNGKFPGGEASDYKMIWIRLKINNRSIFFQNNFKGYITTGSDESRMLYCSENIVTDSVKNFGKGIARPVHFDMYTAGMSDEEIIEYILQQEIKLYYSNILGSKEETISLKNIKKIETEFRHE